MAAATGVRPLRADAQRNRDAILDAARGVFEQEGVLASLDGIALRAGVGNATLYRNFPTRDDLLAAVMDAGIADALAEADGLAHDLTPVDALGEWLVRLAWWLRIWHDLPHCIATAHRDTDSSISAACEPLVARTAVLLDAASDGPLPAIGAEELFELVLALSWAIDRFRDDEEAARRRVRLGTAGVLGVVAR